MAVSKAHFLKLIEQASQPVSSWDKTKAVRNSASSSDKQTRSHKTVNTSAKRNGKSR